MSINLATGDSISSHTSSATERPNPISRTESFAARQRSGKDVTAPYLEAPPSIRPPRRPSLDSIYSEFSELSVLHSDVQSLNLVRQASITSTYSTASDGNVPQTWRQKAHFLYLQNYGALLVLASQIFGCGMNVTTRLLEQPGPHGAPMHPFQILFARQSLTALFCTLYAVTTKSIPYFPLGPPDRNVRLLLVCRGLTGFFGVFGMYWSLLYLPLSEATVLTFLAPILTCYLCSVLIPGQVFSRQQQIAGLVSLSGVIFMAKPAALFSGGSIGSSTGTAAEGNLPRSFTVTNETNSGQEMSEGPVIPTSGQHLLAIGLAMVGVCGATGAMTSIRAIGTRAHALVSVNYFCVWSTIVCTIALLTIPSVSFRFPANMQEWLLLFSLGICGFSLQGLLTIGLAYGGPASVQPVREAPVQPDRQNIDGEDIEMQEGSSSSARKARRTSQKQTKKVVITGSGTRATSMVYTQMLFALLADRIFFGSVPDLWSWIGSGLILAGAIWVAAARDTTKGKVSSEQTSSETESTTGPSRNKGSNIAGAEGSNTNPEEQVGLLTTEELDDESNTRI